MKRILSFLFIFVLSLGMVGCNSQNVKSTKPQVYTSFYAIYDFTKEIAGDYVDVYNMVPTGKKLTIGNQQCRIWLNSMMLTLFFIMV